MFIDTISTIICFILLIFSIVFSFFIKKDLDAADVTTNIVLAIMLLMVCVTTALSTQTKELNNLIEKLYENRQEQPIFVFSDPVWEDEDNDT